MLDIDLREFERKAKQLGAAVDQVPFALSTALNQAALETRRELVDNTWPTHVKVRNKAFIGAALRTEFATKKNLTVAIFDRLGRAHLKLHAKGGVKKAKGRLAIPTRRVMRTASGVRASQKPRNLKRAVVKGGLIFQAEGRGKNSRLRLMYKLQAAARIRKDVPFYEDFAAAMRRGLRKHLPAAVGKAMATPDNPSLVLGGGSRRGIHQFFKI